MDTGATMTTSGSAIFFDGMTSARRTVTVELGATALRVRGPAGEALAEWSYGGLAAYAAPDGVLRLGRAKSPVLARLEIHDRELAAAFTAHAGRVKQFGAVEPRTRVNVVGWSLAAVTSAVMVALFGVPAIVERVAPIVPVRVEQRLGASVDAQVRALLIDRSKKTAFECGDGAGAASRAAFDKLVRRLETTAALPVPINASVVRRSEVNAIALPGGRVYVFEGLVDKANTPDELAGVIAHEMGHVAHRDGVRAVIQAGGLTFLFGMLIGDFSGGGAAVIAMRTVLQFSYSRETEAAADAWGAGLMVKLERDPRALGDILMRIASTDGPTAKILLSHPEARARAAAIETIARSTNVRPAAAPRSDGTGDAPSEALLTAAEWGALKKICQAAPQAKPRTTSHAPHETPQAPRAPSQERPGGEQRGGALPRLEPGGR
jgi:Zn-dependent protease with chaperone function